MRSSEFRCPEHISALKAQELKANLRELLGFMPLSWKVTQRGLGSASTYGSLLLLGYNRKYYACAGRYRVTGTVTKVVETVRKTWHRRKSLEGWAIWAEPGRMN